MTDEVEVEDLFGDMDVESASANYWPGSDWFDGTITNSVTAPSKKTQDNALNEQDIYWVLTVTINGGEWDQTEIPVRHRMYRRDDKRPTDSERRRAKTRVRRTLEGLEIPESRMNSVQGDDLVGTAVRIKTRENSDPSFPPNVTEIKLAKPETSESGMDEFTL